MSKEKLTLEEWTERLRSVLSPQPEGITIEWPEGVNPDDYKMIRKTDIRIVRNER